MINEATESVRSVGGLIPENLFWEFKAARARRHENGNQAIENAIRLYLEVKTEEKENINGAGQE